MHAMRQMIATLCEIFMNRLFSKTFSFWINNCTCLLRRFKNRVPRWISCGNTPTFFTFKHSQKLFSQQNKTKTDILRKRLYSSIQIFTIYKLQSIVLFWTVNQLLLEFDVHNKLLLDEVFVISGIIKVEVSVISRSRRLKACFIIHC